MSLSVKRRGYARAIAVVTASAMVLSYTVPAFAAGGNGASESAVPTEAASVEGYVTGASPRPPAPGLEMLGISDVECDPANNPIMGNLDWSHPKFYLMGTYLYNTNPNPYYVNAVINQMTHDGEVVATPSPIIGGNSAVRTLTKPGGNPDAAIPVYGTTDEADSLWDLQPDVVVGTNGDTSDYTGEEYQAAFAAGGITNYAPKSVRYNYSTVGQIIDSMYRIALAADEVVAQSNGTKKLRYDETALEIAQNYEKYSHSLQGYILYRLAAEGKDMKTLAVVSGYDEAANTYTLLNETTGAGTRFYEVAQNVTSDLSDALGTTTVTRDQLAQADCIILNSSISGSTSADVLETFTAQMQAKTYYNAVGTSAGVLYDTGRNSIDTTAEMGRILGALYNEYISQDELVCYYYDEFYHVKADKLGEVISNAMSGIRNWDATGSDLTAWTEADVADYVKENVQAKLDLGTAYINGLDPAEVNENVAFTTDASGKQYLPTNTTVELSGAVVTVDPTFTYTGSALEPTVSVSYAGELLKEGTDYTVSYANNVNVGTATVTVSGAGIFTGTATASFSITKATVDMSGVTFAGKTVTYNGKAQALAATGVPQGVSVSYEGNGQVNAGTYTVTARFTADANHESVPSMTATLTIAKATNKLTVKKAAKSYKAKKRTGKLAKKKSFAIGAKAKTKVTYTLSAKAKRAGVKVSKAGKVTLKKGTKKGTYKITVKAAGNGNYKAAASKVVKVTVK